MSTLITNTFDPANIHEDLVWTLPSTGSSLRSGDPTLPVYIAGAAAAPTFPATDVQILGGQGGAGTGINPAGAGGSFIFKAGTGGVDGGAGGGNGGVVLFHAGDADPGSIALPGYVDIDTGDPALGAGTGVYVGAALARFVTVGKIGGQFSAFGAALTTQPPDAGALVNATGGAVDYTLVSVATLGLADPAKCNDNFADLFTVVSSIRSCLRLLGWMA